MTKDLNKAIMPSYIRSLLRVCASCCVLAHNEFADLFYIKKDLTNSDAQENKKEQLLLDIYKPV